MAVRTLWERKAGYTPQNFLRVPHYHIQGSLQVGLDKSLQSSDIITNLIKISIERNLFELGFATRNQNEIKYKNCL
jgi:hypothetical protein